MNILIIEDDIFLSQNIKFIFGKKILSNRIRVINSFESFLSEIRIIDSYDIILLDIMLNSKKNGIDILEIIRNKNMNIPVIMMSGLNDIKWLKRAFDMGANDYINKPFRLRELELRVFRWFKGYFCGYYIDDKNIIKYNGLQFNLVKNVFYYKNRELKMTKNNKYLLSIFLKNKEILLTKDYLISKIWGDKDFIIDRNLRVNILRLKKTLKPFYLSNRILSIRGEGYMFKKN